MRFGEHALGAINRRESSKKSLRLHRAKYNEIKEALTEIKAKHPHKFTDKNKLPENDLKNLKLRIKYRILHGRQITLLKNLSLTVIVSLAIFSVAYFIFSYFYNN